MGAIFASGGLEQLKKYVGEMDGESMFSFPDLTLIRPGFLDGDKKLRELFCMHSDKKEFDELEIPLKVVAADMHSGRQVILDSGDLLKALRAFMSYPGLFAPVYHKRRWLIDGGVVDPVPVGVARAMGADIVIAVNLDSELVSRKRHQKTDIIPEIKSSPVRNEFLKTWPPGMKPLRKQFGTVWNSRKKEANAARYPAGYQCCHSAHAGPYHPGQFCCQPAGYPHHPRLGDLKMLDYDQVEHAIEEGYIATREKISDIRMLLKAQDTEET